MSHNSGLIYSGPFDKGLTADTQAGNLVEKGQVSSKSSVNKYPKNKMSYNPLKFSMLTETLIAE